MVHVGGTRKRWNRGARRGSIATVAAALCAVAMLTACGQSHPSGSKQQVSLLPSSALRASSWQYNAACAVGPTNANGCAPAGPNLLAGQLTGDLWNLGSAPGSTGSVRMAFDDAGAMHLTSDLSAAPPCTATTCVAPQANTWVRGYPSILYGIDQCHGATAPPQSSLLKIPSRLADLPSGLIGDTTYDTDTAGVTDDVAYDIWMNPSNTKRPCRIDGTLEVMVWTRYDAQAIVPDGLKIGTLTMPISTNGKADAGAKAWSVYVNNVFRDNHTQPWGGVVWLIPDARYVTDRGNVKVDLSNALDQVATLLQDRYGWHDVRNDYWLDTIQFGAEFGGPNADIYGAAATPFSLDLTSYCLHVGTTVAAAGDC